MNQQPDKIFREKLKTMQKTAPASAWGRIESRLDKKNDKLIWLKIAASITVILSAAILLYINSFDTSQPLLSNKLTDPKKENAKTLKHDVPEKDQTNVKEDRKETITEKTESKKKDRSKKTSSKKAQPQQTHRISAFANDGSVALNQRDEHHQNYEQEVPEYENIQSEIPAVVTADTQDANTKTSTGMTLVYTAEEVNEKYLDKKSLADATQDDKKPSTFKKLLEKAYDLKHNQDPLGDLRQKKNEILALNFKNEKQRSQNR
jgi:hypothetical protein